MIPAAMLIVGAGVAGGSVAEKVGTANKDEVGGTVPRPVEREGFRMVQVALLNAKGDGSYYAMTPPTAIIGCGRGGMPGYYATK